MEGTDPAGIAEYSGNRMVHYAEIKVHRHSILHDRLQ
jgi:hypothetical protein